MARRISQADPYVKRLRDAEAAVQQLEYARADLFSKRLDDEGFCRMVLPLDTSLLLMPGL